MPRMLKENAATPCASAVLRYFGVESFKLTWNARTRENVWPNTLRRNGYAVRSRRSQFPKRCTAGAARAILPKVAANDPEGTAYVVRVPGHVLVMDGQGNTIVDTAPRKRDRRRLVSILAVFPK